MSLIWQVLNLGKICSSYCNSPYKFTFLERGNVVTEDDSALEDG